MSDSPDPLLDVVRSEFTKQKDAAERAMAQVDDEAFFAAIGTGDNSIAVIAKHMAGNLRSRFTDFLTTDGEKPDRNRDGEFELASADTRSVVMAHWSRGWSALFDTIDGLGPADLGRTVRIRGEPATVLQALMRALTHQSQHAGQIVLLAKHLAGDEWRTLSMPRRSRS